MLSKDLDTGLISLILKFNSNFRTTILIRVINVDASDLNHLESLRVAMLKLVLFHDDAFVFLPVLPFVHIDEDSLSLFLQFEDIFTFV
jgi:hypothetical protein